MAADHARLGLQQVLTRFDQEDVRAAVDQAARLLPVHGDQFVEGDLAEGREPRSRSHRPHHETRLLRRGKARRHLAREPGGRPIDFVAPFPEAVLP
jgi:hypothetical protein